jgi:hypothetical protein
MAVEQIALCDRHLLPERCCGVCCDAVVVCVRCRVIPMSVASFSLSSVRVSSQSLSDSDMTQSSGEYGAKMGLGWRDGLAHSFPGAVIKLDFKIRKRGIDVGDIDFWVNFHSTVDIKRMLPPGAFFPAGTSDSTAQVIMAEIKRTCSPPHHLNKVKRFVDFYQQILSPDLAYFPQSLHRQVERTTAILFLFNGSDHVEIRSEFTRLIGEDMQIHGKMVLPIFCPADILIPWKANMESAEMIDGLNEKVNGLEERNRELLREIERLQEQGQRKKRKKRKH